MRVANDDVLWKRSRMFARHDMSVETVSYKSNTTWVVVSGYQPGMRMRSGHQPGVNETRGGHGRRCW